MTDFSFPDDAWGFLGGEEHATAHAGMTGQVIAAAYPEIAQAIKRFHPVKSAAIFAGLLGCSDLQSNCVRLEALVHMCLRFGEGRKTPAARDVADWFNAMDAGICGAFEDPAEDVFVTNVTTRQGNFRLLEGIWETGGFYLQRMLDALDRLETEDNPSLIYRPIEALLRLSEAFCERNDLARYSKGNEAPLEHLPQRIANQARSMGMKAQFTVSDLNEIGISIDDLAPFSFPQDSIDRFAEQAAGHTDLESAPLIFYDDTVVIALPTAVSAAIRRFVHEAFEELFPPGFLVDVLAKEYAAFFGAIPLLGGLVGAPVEFRKTPTGRLAGVTTRIDAGRYLNIIFVMDGLEGFEETGLIGADPDDRRHTDAIDYWIGYSYDQVAQEADFAGMDTIVVMCGIGRAVNPVASETQRDKWRFLFVSAPDFYTLSLLPDFDVKTLWRLLDASDELGRAGVNLFNVNGLLNLVAWSRNLEGHLVPHPLVEDAGGDDSIPINVMVDQNGLCRLRHEVATRTDEHCLLSVEGRYERVMRTGSSFFDADKDIPLFHGVDPVSMMKLRQVYEGEQSNWWSEIDYPSDEHTDKAYVYSWFELLKAWVPKLVPVLEDTLETVTAPAVLLKVFVEPLSEDAAENAEPLSFTEASEHLVLDVDKALSTVEMHVVSGFERAFSAPDNRGERAIIARLIEGIMSLVERQLPTDEQDALLARVIPNPMARQSHRFASDDFRDRLRAQANRKAVSVDPLDDATLKLGLGWRVRDRSEGATIERAADCCAYLNALGATLVDELCERLGQFDRASVIRRCLHNHEVSAVERARWKRTSAAIEALREGQADVREKIVSRFHAMNGVSQASRQLIELAICECPLSGGRPLGEIDLSRMMSRLLMAIHLSSAADAIHKGAMTPTVKILAMGDIQLDYSFYEGVVQPHAVNLVNSNVDAAIRDYQQNYIDDRHDTEPVETSSVFNPEFEAALEAELGASLFDIRTFVDHVENLAFLEGKLVIQRPRSVLLDAHTEIHRLSSDAAERLVSSWTLAPRSSWSAVEGYVTPSDLYVGRFRRQISMLRRPLLRIDQEDDPQYLICPGIVREAFAYQLRHFHAGDYKPDHIKSLEMRAWKSKVDGEKGHAFETDVLERLRELGWKARHSVNITEIFGRALDRNYGEIDVLAWKPETDEILILECKNMAFRQSPGELAEQLSDFQGVMNSKGKPDLLLKHLDRVRLFERDPGVIMEFCGLAHGANIRNALVFRVPVPVIFATGRVPEGTAVLIYDEIAEQLSSWTS